MSTQSHWVAGFRSAVVSPYEKLQFSSVRSFRDQTLRQFLRLPGGGGAVRVRLSNTFGREPLRIGAAGLARRSGQHGVDLASSVPLTFDGRFEVTLAPGEELASDPVADEFSAGTQLAVSVWFPYDTGPATHSVLALETGYALPGNATEAVDLTGAEALDVSRYFLTGVDVLVPGDLPIAVAFGDSWMEGTGTTPGADNRFPDQLNRRLRHGWVVNQGISGNRLLTDEIGEHALSRVKRDVLDVPGATHVLLNLGLNDLVLPGVLDSQFPNTRNPRPTARELIGGYTELGGRLRAAGLTVIAHTIGPYAGAVDERHDTAELRATRHEVNDWIRATDVFDAVTDVAAAVSDPADRERILPAFDSGDHLHLNDRGVAAMADAVDLARLRL